MDTLEKHDLQKTTFRVGGMTCVNCQNRIEKKLRETPGVQDATVDYNTGIADIYYDTAKTSFEEISAAIESLGYKALKNNKNTVIQIIGTLVIIFVLFMLLRAFGTSKLAAAFPLAREGMGYGMLLLIGLFTSVHCIAMCGGINLSQTLQRNADSVPTNLTTEDCYPATPDSLESHRGIISSIALKLQAISEGDSSTPCNSVVKNTNSAYMLLPSIFYNGGRLVSYTAVGVLVGALGSVITLSGHFQGAVQLAAGVFMLIMGINMLGLFPALRRFSPRMPKIFAAKIDGQKTGRGPLLVGLLNGLMPCGPLQAMQLYALSTGSPIRGGVSMFLFCAGTIPLMFALGAASSALSGAKGRAFSRYVMQAGAVLVTALGLVMFSNGWSLSGFPNPLDRAASSKFVSAQANTGAIISNAQNGVQIVNSTLQPGRYPAITVQQGIPVRWIINAPPGSINGCNNRMIISEYGIQYTFKQGDNVIEFFPERAGRFRYTCWMAMIQSTITVLAEGESAANLKKPDITPKPAGVRIPTDTIAVAQITDNTQAAAIRLGGEGFDPAVVVMQRRLPALWIIAVESTNSGNSGIIFPAYYTGINTTQGENQLRLVPDEDFEFYTIDGLFYGYVKVVDDIARMDIGAIKAEVNSFETLVYPEAYFEAALGDY